MSTVKPKTVQDLIDEAMGSNLLMIFPGNTLQNMDLMMQTLMKRKKLEKRN